MTLLMRDAEKREEGRAEGRVEGRAEGEAKFAALTEKLLEAKRYEDLDRVAKDIEYRHALYMEFGMDSR